MASPSPRAKQGPGASKHGGKLAFALHPSQPTHAEKRFMPLERHLI